VCFCFYCDKDKREKQHSVSIWKKQEMREALNQYGFGYVE